MCLSSRVYRKFRLLAVAALVISVLGAGSALARGKRVQGTGHEQCYVTPNPVSNDGSAYYTVVGTGFLPWQMVEIDVAGYGTQVLYATTDAYGNFAASRPASLLMMDGVWTVSTGYGGAIVAVCYLQVT